MIVDNQELESRIETALLSDTLHGGDAFLLCPASPLMLQLGFGADPVLITLRHLRNITLPVHPNYPERHGLSIQSVAQTPEILADPALVIPANRAAIMFISDRHFGPQGQPLVLVIQPHGKGWIRNSYVDANFLLSLYPCDRINQIVENLRPESIKYAQTYRARRLLARLQIPFAHLAPVLSGSGFISRKINEREGYPMSEIKIVPGDTLYSRVSIEDLSTSRFIVTDVDQWGNLKALPIVAAPEGDHPGILTLKPDTLASRAFKPFAVILHTEVQMSAAWPVLRQPFRLSEPEMQELLQKKEVWQEANEVFKIQADQPTGPAPDLDEEIANLYNNFTEDPSLLWEYIDFSSRFYRFSQRNQALIYFQNPQATFVASQAKWSEMGYRVRPEHMRRGIEIYRPVQQPYFERGNYTLKLNRATPEERYQIAAGQIKTSQRTFFVLYNVYDISQTTCPVEEYPRIYNKGQESPAHAAVFDATKKVAELEGIHVTRDDLASISMGGYFSPDTNSIHINQLEQDSHAAVVMLHEYSHALLHNTSSPDLPTAVKEFEAQGTAVMLLKHYGCTIEALEQKYLVDCLTKAINENPDFKIEKSLTRMGKQFAHAKERIDQQLELSNGLGHSLQKGPQQEQDLKQLASEICENFLQGL